MRKFADAQTQYLNIADMFWPHCLLKIFQVGDIFTKQRNNLQESQQKFLQISLCYCIIKRSSFTAIQRLSCLRFTIPAISFEPVNYWKSFTTNFNPCMNIFKMIAEPALQGQYHSCNNANNLAIRIFKLTIFYSLAFVYKYLS